MSDYVIDRHGLLPTYSFANHKFKKSHELIVIKIEESLKFQIFLK